MKNEPVDRENLTEELDAMFTQTMKRAGVDWEPAPPRPRRTARGTAAPESDDDITQKLPVVRNRPVWQEATHTWPGEPVSLGGGGVASPPRARRWTWSLARGTALALTLVLVLVVSVGLAVWWATR